MLVLDDVIKGGSVEFQLLLVHFDLVFCPWDQELDFWNGDDFVACVFSDLGLFEDQFVQGLGGGFDCC